MNTETIQIPAILGGPPAVTLDHETSNKWPNLSHLDEASVLQIMRDGNISTHPVIRELEREYADFTGQKYALAHNNGTSALLAAFYSIGLQPGDEVLVPSATFWASVLPMTWIGAIPVFCESEKERMGIDPVDMERKITDRTKAIVIVHLWGLPSKMTEIFALAEKYNLRIVEDASHAHGATWRGRQCGALGDVSVFSMQGDKLAPAGEGGVFLCNDYEYDEEKTELPRKILLQALLKEGCQVALPRYPLLHQQPFFSEGVFVQFLRLPPGERLPSYTGCSLPSTEAANNSLLKLPSFPNQDNGILDQYVHAFEKVIGHAHEIVGECNAK